MGTALIVLSMTALLDYFFTMIDTTHTIFRSPGISSEYEPETKLPFFWIQAEQICYAEAPNTRILVTREVDGYGLVEDFILVKTASGWNRYVAVYFSDEPSPYGYDKDLLYE